VVRTNHYLVFGDNTMNSWDGRGWGDFPREHVVARHGSCSGRSPAAGDSSPGEVASAHVLWLRSRTYRTALDEYRRTRTQLRRQGDHLSAEGRGAIRDGLERLRA